MYEKRLNDLIRKKFKILIMIDKKYNFFKPLKNNNLIRLGRKADGGYVVDKDIVEKTNFLITFGMVRIGLLN